MLNTKNSKALLFDFGGTIDTGGTHWVHVLYRFWKIRRPELSFATYKNAFAFGERTLASEKIITPSDNFLDLLEKKVAIQASFLEKHNRVATLQEDQQWIADKAYRQAAATCAANGKLLGQLKERYWIAMVSNFYGNLRTVLEDFGILSLFETITESAVVGVKKPDPEIWNLGCLSLGIPPSETIAIGDSLGKDMEAARAIGCQGIWILGSGWDDPQDTGSGSAATSAHQRQVANRLQLTTVTSLSELPGLLS